MPDLYIIAGPNGVGKTSYAKEFLPHEVRCREFVNTDLIAQGLSPFAPDGVSLLAGRLTFERLSELLKRGETFSFETTLTGRGYVRFLERCRLAGYRISLDFLWVSDLAVSSSRVAQRVVKGGHNIPAEVQLRRFHLGLSNLFNLYHPLIDHWRLLDNSGPEPVRIAEMFDEKLAVYLPSRLDEVRALFVSQILMSASHPSHAGVSSQLSAATTGVLRAMNRAFAKVVLENHQFGLPVIQFQNGQMVETPAADLLPLAQRFLANNGELTASQLGR